jgi:hypothetical protein
MAGRAAKLPKWQEQQMLCQNLCQIGIANLMPQKIFFILIFFSCIDDILRYNQSIRKRERKCKRQLTLTILSAVSLGFKKEKCGKLSIRMVRLFSMLGLLIIGKALHRSISTKSILIRI